MNKTHRIVYNKALNQWVAVAETAKANGKGGRLTTAVRTKVTALATTLTTLTALLSLPRTVEAACSWNATTQFMDCTGWTTGRVIGGTWTSTGGGSHGLNLDSGAIAIHNHAGGTISSNGTWGGADGITNYNENVFQQVISFKIINDGAILGNHMGIQGGMVGGSSWDLENNGLIQGGGYGVAAGTKGTVAGTSTVVINNNSTGVITGGLVGIYASGQTLVNNYGTITGTKGSADGNPHSTEGVGIYFTNGTVNQHAGSINGAILGDTGVNVVNVKGGTVTGNTYLSGGNDTVEISGGVVTGNVNLDTHMSSTGTTEQTGNDTLIISAGTGNDSVTVTGGVLTGNTDLGEGNNNFAISGGTVTGDISAGSGADTYTVTGGSVTGNSSLGDGSDTFGASGGQINGSVFLEAGDDTAAIGGNFNTTGLVELSGGEGDDGLTISGLTVRGYTASSSDTSKGVNLTGWEVIDLSDAATLKLTGDLFDSGASGQLNIESGSTLDLTGNSPGIFTIHGSVDNAGLVTMQDGAGDDATTLTGDYTATNGSWKIDTVFNDDSSATDKLIVQGNTSGNTTININNIGGTGAQTTNGILLVQVDGTSAANSFAWDIGHLQVGNYQYVLQQGSAIDANDWYLVSAVQSCEALGNCPPPPPPPPAGCAALGNCPKPPTTPPVYVPTGPKPVPLWRPAISGYSVARSMNADVGFLQSATLHQRMGDLAVQNIDQGKSWVRLLGQDLSGTGKDRFDYDQRSKGIQLGRDLWNKLNDEGQQKRMGVMLHHVNSQTDAWDQVRPAAGLTRDTADIKTKSTGLGLYRTTLETDGRYHDWVLQVNKLTNDFTDSYGGKAQQSGKQLGLSYEHGRPLRTGETWIWEGQGQISGLHTRYDAFEDKFSKMQAENFDAVRARLGLRIHNGAKPKNEARYYGIFNINHDIVKTKKMTLSAQNSTQSKEVGETFDQTFAELGIGAQKQLSDNTWGFVDARYEHGIQNRKNTWRLNLGVRF